MTLELKMPQYGMGMTEGTMVEWLKGEGDRIEAGEVIGSVEASKSTSDLIAPVSGILTKILVPLDETVPVQTPIAIIDED